MSSALALQTSDGVHLAFVLTHFEADSSVSGVQEGECVFMALPTDPAYLDHPLLDLVYAHKFAGEHQCILTVTGARHEYEIRGQSVDLLRIVLTAGSGEWIDVKTGTMLGKVVTA